MFKQSLKFFLCLLIVTGLIYPLLITLIAQLIMPFQANGSFITKNNQLIGSHLIGQKFVSEKYFWGRPSYTDYQAKTSGGSNLGPISAILKRQVKERQIHLKKMHPSEKDIPSDLLFASGSGIDPHISIEAAYYQKNRILNARGYEKEFSNKLDELIEKKSLKKMFGFLGGPCVNVLELNLALDELEQQP